MKRIVTFAGLALFAAPLQGEAPSALAPSEIVAAAPAGDWVAIAPADLLVMDLAPDAGGRARRVVIQLMPPPFSQGWIGNIRKLAVAHWWDGLSINRVQDNYVVQWGDAEAEDAAQAKRLPAGLARQAEADYVVRVKWEPIPDPITDAFEARPTILAREGFGDEAERPAPPVGYPNPPVPRDSYVKATGFYLGWPLGGERAPRDRPELPGHVLAEAWPVHCYGMVGVGRNLSPDTGSGAELYAVIGHAPRHLDRNIAVVGRVIEGIEHLSSLPRGTGALGFYEQPEQRVRIASIRLGGEVAGLPSYQYLSTDSESFARYADARANRRDAFFIWPAGGADICNLPVPVRRAGGGQ